MSSGLNCVICPVTPFAQNCTLIWDTQTGRGAFVDAGGEPDALRQIAQEHGVTIEKLLVTHGHVDHCAATAGLAAELGVPIEGPHKDDAFWIERLPEVAKGYGFPPAQTFTPDRWLDDGDTVSVGELQLQVIHCPGHTPGHVVFYHAPSKLAIVGDVLFQGSIGRTDFPRGNHQDLLDSIRQKLFPLGNDVSFIPGHGPMSTFGDERRSNPFVADRLFAAAR